jgi:hypothetical protein
MEKQSLNRRKDVELFEAIRREYEFGVGTVKGVARKFGVHRRMVREALADAVPKERKIIERVRPKLEPAVPFINAILESDLKAPRKQRHTAHRIYNRLLVEKPENQVGGSDGSCLCAFAKAENRTDSSGDVRAAVVHVGAGRAGGLV